MSLFSKTTFDRVCKLFGNSGLSLIRNESAALLKDLFKDKSVKDDCCRGKCSARYAFIYMDTTNNVLYFQDGLNIFPATAYYIRWYYRDEDTLEWILFAQDIGTVDLSLYPSEVMDAVNYRAEVRCKKVPGWYTMEAGRGEAQLSVAGVFFSASGGSLEWTNPVGYICQSETLAFAFVHPDYEVFNFSIVNPYVPSIPNTIDIDSGTYLVEVHHIPSDTYGYGFVDVIFVENASNFSPNAPQNLCSGDTLLLTAVNPNHQHYQWKRDGVNIPGANASTYTAAVAGSYSLYVRNTVGPKTCDQLSAGVQLTAAEKPLPVIEADKPNPVCAGGTPTVFSTQYTEAEGYSFLWNNGTEFTETVSTAGAFWVDVVVTSPNGCQSEKVYYPHVLTNFGTGVLGGGIVNESAPGACDGQITVTILQAPTKSEPVDYDDPSQGFTTYATGETLEFSIDNGPWQSSNVFSGLCAGTYPIRARNTTTGCIKNILNPGGQVTVA